MTSPSRLARSVALALAIAQGGCAAPPAAREAPRPVPRPGGGASLAAASSSFAPRAVPPPVPAPPPTSSTLEVAACSAPSLTVRAPRDRRDAVPECASLGPLIGGTDPRSCGSVLPAGGLSRLDEAVLPLDATTRTRIVEIAKRGKAMGRHPRAFGLVGDSITEGLLFLGPFAAGSTQPVELAAAVSASFSTTLEGRASSILDVYRGFPVERLAGFSRDSFRATRAAKIGAPSAWALRTGTDGLSPLSSMIDRLHPAVAVVMYGSNDAAAGLIPLDALTSRFEANLRRIVLQLDAAGIVPILSTIPRRGPQGDIRDCAADGFSDARLMVQTNAVSAAAARLACSEHLPLVDLRHAFDGLVSAGLFSDGIHPTSHARGSGVLTEAGLGCGYNARNYLTLRALREVREVMVAEGIW